MSSNAPDRGEIALFETPTKKPPVAVTCTLGPASWKVS